MHPGPEFETSQPMSSPQDIQSQPSLKVVCPHCRKVLKATEKTYGKVVRCPACSQPITIPRRPELLPSLRAIEEPSPPTETSQAVSSQQDAQSQAEQDIPVRCPNCGSAQFFGTRRVTTIGWLLYATAIADLLISIPLMYVCIGFFTIFFAPVLAMIGFYGCRKLVNTCARCKRDF